MGGRRAVGLPPAHPQRRRTGAARLAAWRKHLRQVWSALIACCRSLGCGLRAGSDQRIIRRVADTTRCGPLGREGRSVPGATAIGDEQHLIIAALSRAACRVAVRADDPRRRRRSGGTRGAGRPWRSGIAFRSRRPGWSRITLFAAYEANGQHDCDQGSIQGHGFPQRTASSGV
jgi:hypothetical protein